jgi:AcrR family transcriptional regulator
MTPGAAFWPLRGGPLRGVLDSYGRSNCRLRRKGPAAMVDFKLPFENQARMTRPSDYTRQSIMKAAVELFAEKGFDGASVRAIVAKARVNQAAINYHFDGKDGLYLEVLKVAFDAFTRHDGLDADKLAALPRDEALRGFVYQQLRPLLFRDEISRYVRIFAWENVRPSKVLRGIMATSAAPFLARAVALVRRFLPASASDQEAMCAAIWLMGQCSIFLRNREQLTQTPFDLKIDEPFVERLADLITRLALGGLAQQA